ncbi:MAG: DUF167 domain-containing protein [Sedimentisphaerales bacterium]|nr:DUF167 domain-containing protein [Sedimentisphaerales bacterium]
MSDKPPADKKESIKITSRQNAAVFYVKVVPAGSKTSFEGVYDGMLKIKLSAAPEKGKANQALIDFLAETLGVRKKFIKIVSGMTSKVKQVCVEQISPQIVAEKFGINL